MDRITRSVKKMYERYPYPAGSPDIRSGFNVRLLLSYVEQSSPDSTGFNVLDAGCGRGLGLIGAATTQQDVRFLGVDINTTGLQDAQRNAAARNLTNIQFAEDNLMTLTGIDVPENGFDVIFSSGVLHHLSNPEAGLKRLKEVLAPHGVISLMVYGRYGRQALYRLIESINVLCSDEEIQQRLPDARGLASVADTTIFRKTYWQGSAEVNDIEFVDRCLNVNETSYDIDSLWNLIEAAGLRFVRWTDRTVWDVNHLIDDPHLLIRLQQLQEKEQFQIIERLFERPKLELVLCHKHNLPRTLYNTSRLNNVTCAVNPEVSIFVEKRNLHHSQRCESMSYSLRDHKRRRLTDPVLAKAVLLLSDQTTSFTGQDLITSLVKQGIEKAAAEKAPVELLEKEILYLPHESDR